MLHTNQLNSDVINKGFLAAIFYLLMNLNPVIAADEQFVFYEKFYASLGDAKYKEYARREQSKVVNEKEFHRMRSHVATMYEGVAVKNSFLLDNNYVDCTDINTQPGLKHDGKRLTIQKPPPALINPKDDNSSRAKPIAPMLGEDMKDTLGNTMYCEKGYIPIRRITLDEIVRFKTLDDFLNKYGKSGMKGNPVVDKQ